MHKIRYVICLLLFYSCNTNAVVVIVDGESGDGELTPLIDVLNVSTGGSGGEDRLTENLTNVFISTGGSGGEDRLTDLFGGLLVSTGGSGSEDRFTDIFDEIVNPASGTSLSNFLGTIVLTEPTSTVLITAYDLFASLYVSQEVVGLFSDYTQYRVETNAVPEPAAFVCLLLGLLILPTIQCRRRRMR